MAQLTEHHLDLAAETLTYTEQLDAAAEANGLRKLLLRLLPKRLGPAPDEARRWLAQASLHELEATTDDLFQHQSWKDVIGSEPSHWSPPRPSEQP